MSVVFMGDSILRNVLTTIWHKPNFFAGVPGKRKGACDMCVGGQTIKALIKKVKKVTHCTSIWRRDLSGATVVLMIGTNDVLRKRVRDETIEQVLLREMRWLLRTICSCGVSRIVLCTVPPLVDQQYFAGIQVLNSVIRRCSVEQSEFIRCADVFASFETNGGTGLISQDRVHPSLEELRTISNVIESLL